MRVAILSSSAKAGDGIGNSIADKVAFFVERGADVRLFLETPFTLHPYLAPFCRGSSRAEPTVDERDYLANADLILAEFGHAHPLLGWLPLLAGGKARILLDYHGVTPPDLWDVHQRHLLAKGRRLRGLAWCADAVLTHSRFTRCELNEPTGFPLERCHILGHPVDLDRFVPRVGGPVRRPGYNWVARSGDRATTGGDRATTGAEENKMTTDWKSVLRHRDHNCWRQRLGLPSVAILLLFVGRVAPNKRLPVLVEALGKLRDCRPPIHALIIGDDADVYSLEKNRCLELAEQLQVADRLHFTGTVSNEDLRAAYHSADVFVTPSWHEGFCIPVIEAMASGLPVVAARAGALPETVADAGLTFVPDEPDDLCRQVSRVLQGSCASVGIACGTPRVAVVTLRFGTDIVGGAESSLLTMARTLQQAGHHVEVFATSVMGNRDGAAIALPSTSHIDDIPVHRFPAAGGTYHEFHKVVQNIVDNDGIVSDEMEAAYIQDSAYAPRLMDDLRHRIGDFDAILTGPALSRLTYEVAREFPDKTIVVPCFHNEPLARLGIWKEAYSEVGGLLFHSPEEQTLTQTELGVNNPGAVCAGTIVETTIGGDPDRGRRLVGAARPYLLYCGRLLQEKNVPLLLEYAKEYAGRHPDRFNFVFVGQGNVPIPTAPWARNLGFVDEAAKRDLMAAASALIQLSTWESLSLVALEAWAQEVPVIANRRCDVLAGHIARSGGGAVVDSFEPFAAALDDLWDHPDEWKARGRRGRDDVVHRYSSPAQYLLCLEEAVRDLQTPLAERMRRKGILRARQYGKHLWRERFGVLVEHLLDSPGRPYEEKIEVKPRSEGLKATAGAGLMLVPARVTNRGTHTLTAEGPGRCVLVSRVGGNVAPSLSTLVNVTPLPELLVPGQSLTVPIPVGIPNQPGTYQVQFEARGPRAGEQMQSMEKATITQMLQVDSAGAQNGLAWYAPIVEAARASLADAHRLQCLPEDYTDVSAGRFAVWKGWLKRKLLGNFKRAYVDVLSRQQSAFNQKILAALSEMTECCVAMGSAVDLDQSPGPGRWENPVNPRVVSASNDLTEKVETPSAQGRMEDLVTLCHDLIAALTANNQRLGLLEERVAHWEKSKDKGFKSKGKL